MTIKLLGKTFATQKALIEYVRRLRDRYADGQRIKKVDKSMVFALFEANPECATKIGNRCISHFEVRNLPVANATLLRGVH